MSNENPQNNNIPELQLELADKNSKDHSALLEMILEKLAEKDNMPELQLELLDKTIKKLEEIKTKLSEPVVVELEII